MLQYTLKRLLIAAGLIWTIATVVFLVIHLIPGDPAELLLSQGGIAADPDTVAALRKRLNLDQPILVQYWTYLVGLLQGDLGVSLQDGTPVFGEILIRLPRTLELILAAALVALAWGMPMGVFAGLRPGGAMDRIATSLSGFLLSVPVFVIGTLFILFFAERLRIVPAGGYVSPFDDLAGHLRMLLMPAATIGLGLGAVVCRITRSSVAEITNQPFIRAARARGLTFFAIVRQHILPNAMIPIVTVFALQLGTMLGGTVIIEYIYNWPGLSGYLVRSVEARDYPEIVGIIVVISTIFVLLNLLIDLIYAWIDPRVRYS